MDKKTRKTVAASLRSAAAKLQAAGEPKPPKFKIGDRVFSYQNRDKPAKINYIRLSEDPKFDHAYRLSLPDGNSNWINESSLSKKAGDVEASVSAASDEFPALDPKSAMVYFDLYFEEDNLEEDQGPNADEDQQQRAAEFLATGKGDITNAARKAEDDAMKEIGAMLKKAGLNVRLGNEGHGSGDELVMKFGIDTVDQVKKLVDFIKRNTGGGEDVIYLNAPYMEARDFVLFPVGVNNDGFSVNGDGDIEEWLEAQGG
jgi:hypothetical protein